MPLDVFLVADMEGVTGLVYWPRPRLGGRDARDDERQRRAFADDVNAVTRGARAAGAGRVDVLDFHGSNPPRPNLLPGDLDPGARLISGFSTAATSSLPLDAGYAACFILGMHAMDGVADGVLSHSFNSNFRAIEINGIRMGEIGYWALLAGVHGIPVALLTGDDAACREAQELLGDVEVVSTKQGIAHGFARLRPPAEARDALVAGARRALERRAAFRPFTLEPPYRVEVELGGGRETRKADACALMPFVERAGATRVAYSSDSLAGTLSALRGLLLLAGTQRFDP